MRRFINIFSLGLLLMSSLSTASESIGKVLIAKGVVTASTTQNPARTLAKGSDVFLGETVSTASDSFVVLKMADSSKISLRPKSEVVLEMFNQSPGQEEALFDLVKGGLRALSGEIGKKRPEQYRVQTSIATIGIRGTDFLVRLCLEDCSKEESLFGDAPRQNAGPASGGSPAKRKQLRRLDEKDNVTGSKSIECRPISEIKEGLYTAVFDGRIWMQRNNEVLELEAVEAAFAQRTETVCMSEIPHFIIEDKFLSKEPGETFTLFNILRNIEDDQQRCEIPEA